jgi:Arc/MetJ-type ribon-helix-helix transcriptional regulator
MAAKPVTVSLDADRLERIDGWVRAGRFPNRSRAVEAALDLLERASRLPTLQEALAHPRYPKGSPEWRAWQRESKAIDRFADALETDVDSAT